jgi:hypothetical protein
MELLFKYNGSGDITNRISMGFYGGGNNTILNVLGTKRVGIMKTDPGYALDVTGDCNISEAYKMDGADVIDSSKKFVGSGGVDVSARILMKTDGYGFSLRGANEGSYASKEMISYIGNDCLFGTYSADNFNIITNNIARMGVSGTNADVWIGNTNLSAYSRLYVEANDTLQYALHLKGGFDYTGLGTDAITQMIYSASGAARTTSWSGTNKVSLLVEGGGIMIEDYAVASYSDRRRKEDIHYYKEDDNKRLIDGINSIKICSFRYKSDGHQSVGLIAQDMAKASLVEPLSYTHDESMKIEQEMDLDKIAYSLDYSKIGVLLIPYVQDLHKENTIMKDIINNLQEENQYIKLVSTMYLRLRKS